MTGPRAETDVVAIRQGQADVRASHIAPHAAVMAAAGIAAPDAQRSRRAVVWADCAREATREPLRADAILRRAVAERGVRLGQAPAGFPGRLPDTYETAVPGTSFVLVFELVTWTKAGEVIAILALAGAPRVARPDAPLWAERG